MKAHTPEFWYELGVNPSDVRRELGRDSVETIDSLQNSSLMSEVVTKTISRLTGCDSFDELADEKTSLFIEIWCIWKFYQNRRRVYLIRKYVDDLGTSVRRQFLRREEARRSSFNCLLLASVFKDELLKRFLLMDGVDIRSFQKLRLGGVAVESSFNSLNSSKVREIALSLIQEFEEKRKEQKESVVERVLFENSRTFLFVRRQIKESIVTQAKNSIIVRPAERIVVQFLKGGREAHVSARTKKIALDFVNLFAQRAWGKKAVYERILSSNKETRIRSFLEAISSTNAKLPIVSISVSQSPLEGYPDLDLYHQETLAPSIKQLKAMGLDILSDVENIEQLVVRFESTDVELRPMKNRDGTFELRYSDNKLQSTKRETFEREMKEEWQLAVTPKG